MYLDYSKIKTGQLNQPILRLRTLAGKELGAIPWVHNLVFEINYSDISSIQFEVPLQSDGKINPVYKYLTSYKVVYTEQFGIYVLGSPTKNGDGLQETKTVVGYSLEKLFEKKNLFLEEGTYNFWNPVQPEDTILGRILELDTTWKVGYVDPKLIGCYRTFDEYDNNALSFCYGDAMEKYQCAIVFDVYKKTINAYDATKNGETLPIYLDYKNLVEELNVEELTDEIVTKLHVYGSDDLTIRDVNPAGTDYLVDLSYFVENGDLDIKVGNATQTLAERVKNWQTAIQNRQQYYTSLIAARASKTAQKMAEIAALTDLNNELESLQAQQSIIIQSIALETTSSGKVAQQAKLDEINTKIATKQADISNQQSKINNLQSEIDRYADDIVAVNNELALGKYFSPDELQVLNLYLIEDDISEETFVATEFDSSVSGVNSTISGAVSINGSDILRLSVNNKTLYTIAGGALSIPSAKVIADVVRGTLEIDATGQNYILTGYLGTTNYGDHNFSSGMITMSGSCSQFSSDILTQIEDGISEDKGSRVSFQTQNSNLFFTVNVSEYQKYSVAQELYNFGAEALGEMSWPVYEFTLSSANFLYQKAFEPFKNKLELGKAIYINMQGDGIVQANIIGVTLDFENPNDFSLVFSNKYRQKNGVETIADTISKSSASSRNFDANKYLYNQVANKTTQVSRFMEGQLNAAVNTIVGASNQSVVINGAGIQVGGNSKYQLRIVDNMIAMTDDNWKTAKLALGLFATPETGEQWGVNAEMLAGKLIIGNSMVLENATDDGVMQFKVDSTGAWLNNSTFVLQKDNGGRMILDPAYGLMAGTKLLFDTDGTTVKPSFIDSDGDLDLDSDGMPKNTNFFLDIRDGSAYFRGKVKATSGAIGGWTLESDYLHGGSGTSFVALNGSGSNDYSLYAMWAGAQNPDNAKFWVKKNGELYASTGTFKGTLSAAKLSGNLIADADSGGWLKGCGIDVNDGVFYVDTLGNVTMKGNINMKAGTITWSKDNSPVKVRYSNDGITWHDSYITTDYFAEYSYDGGQSWTEAIKIQGADGKNGKDGKDGRDGYDGSDANVTFRNVNSALGTLFKTWSGGTPTTISGSYIYSPNVKGGAFYGSAFYAGEGDGYAEMIDTGLNVYTPAGSKKISMGYYTNKFDYPYITLGCGSNSNQSDAGLVMKFGAGVWLGTSSVMSAGGTRPPTSDTSATGLFVDFTQGKVYKYINGVRSELEAGAGGSGGSATAVFG